MGDVDDNNHIFSVSLFSIAFASVDAHPHLSPYLPIDTQPYDLIRK